MCHYRGASIKCVDVTKHHNWSPVLTVSGPIREPRPITGTVRRETAAKMTTVLQVPGHLLLASPVPVVSVWPAPCCAVYLCLCCVSTRHYALHSTEAAGRYTSPHTALCRTQTLQTQHQHRSRVLCSRCGSSTRKHRLTIRY